MGFLSKTYDRYRNDEKRLEDKHPFEIYLSKVEWVDFGHDVLYAKNDFEINDEKLMSLNEIKSIIELLPNNISILNKNHIKWLQDNCKTALYQNDEDKQSGYVTKICCVKKNDYITFNLLKEDKNQNTKYYLNESTIIDIKKPQPILQMFNNLITQIEITEIGPKKFPSYLGTPKIIHVPKSDDDVQKYMIKLVKLK